MAQGLLFLVDLTPDLASKTLGGGNDRGEPTASVLSADGFPLMAGPNLQPSDGNPIVISILRQLADVPENVPEI
jgi:hypothetical protein